jgi:hypothetical protein
MMWLSRNGCRYQKLDRTKRGTRPGNSPFRLAASLALESRDCGQVYQKGGLDWACLYYVPGVEGIRRKVRVSRPDCLFKRLVARTGDEVHRLQEVQSRDQARAAEWVATQRHLC